MADVLRTSNLAAGSLVDLSLLLANYIPIGDIKRIFLAEGIEIPDLVATVSPLRPFVRALNYLSLYNVFNMMLDSYHPFKRVIHDRLEEADLEGVRDLEERFNADTLLRDSLDILSGIQVRVYSGSELIEDPELFIISSFIVKQGKGSLYINRRLLKALYAQHGKKEAYIEALVSREHILQQDLMQGRSYEEAHRDILGQTGQKALLEFTQALVRKYSLVKDELEEEAVSIDQLELLELEGVRDLESRFNSNIPLLEKLGIKGAIKVQVYSGLISKYGVDEFLVLSNIYRGKGTVHINRWLLQALYAEQGENDNHIEALVEGELALNQELILHNRTLYEARKSPGQLELQEYAQAVVREHLTKDAWWEYNHARSEVDRDLFILPPAANRIYNKFKVYFGIPNDIDKHLNNRFLENSFSFDHYRRYLELADNYGLERVGRTPWIEDSRDTEKLNRMVLKAVIAEPDLRDKLLGEIKKNVGVNRRVKSASEILTTAETGDLESLTHREREIFYDAFLMRAAIFGSTEVHLNFFQYITALEACEEGYFGGLKAQPRTIKLLFRKTLKYGALYKLLMAEVLLEDNASLGRTMTNFIRQIGLHFLLQEASSELPNWRTLAGQNSPYMTNSISEGISTDFAVCFLSKLADIYGKEGMGRNHGFDYYAETELLRVLNEYEVPSSYGEISPAKFHEAFGLVLVRSLRESLPTVLWKNTMLPNLRALIRGHRATEDVYRNIIIEVLAPVLRGELDDYIVLGAAELLKMYARHIELGHGYVPGEGYIGNGAWGVRGTADKWLEKGLFTEAGAVYVELLRRFLHDKLLQKKLWRGLEAALEGMKEKSAAEFAKELSSNPPSDNGISDVLRKLTLRLDRSAAVALGLVDSLPVSIKKVK